MKAAAQLAATSSLGRAGETAEQLRPLFGNGCRLVDVVDDTFDLAVHGRSEVRSRSVSYRAAPRSSA